MLSQSQLDRDIELLEKLRDIATLMENELDGEALGKMDDLISDLNASISRQKDGE